METYLLKSVACMAIFFAFYKLVLERERMHLFKRFYLLLAIVASLLIPTLVFTEYVIVDTIASVQGQAVGATDYDYVGAPGIAEKEILNTSLILWNVYFLGLAFFGFRFIKHLHQIYKRIRRNPKQKSSRFIQVLLRENFPPHTFFRYIFLNKKKLESNEIPKEVLLHEETHAKQKHSLDVIFIELMQVVFWFNPFVFLFNKAIKLNHEFLADEAVLKKDIDQHTYQNTLLSYLSPDSHYKYQSRMANAINYSSIKKRFTVMKKNTSKKSAVLRALLLIPLVALLIFGFAQKDILEVHSNPNASIEGVWVEAVKEASELVISTTGPNLLLKWSDGTFWPIHELNGQYYQVDSNKKLPMHYDSAQQTLTFYENIKYIPLNKSIKGQFLGQWQNSEDNITFNIGNGSTEIVWDVIKNNEKPVRYYPKKQGDSYAFTYEGELWSFNVKDGLLHDSNGTSYKRMPEQITQHGTLPSEDIQIQISRNGDILANGNSVAIEFLHLSLKKYNSTISKEEREKSVRAFILPEKGASVQKIRQVERILIGYGVAQLSVVGPDFDSSLQEGATQEQLDFYYAFAKKHLKQTKSERRNTPKSVLQKVAKIYEQMNPSQREAVAKAFPDLPPPPPRLKSKEENKAIKTYKKPSEKVIKLTEGATKKELNAYNTLAKKYNSMLSKDKGIQIKMNDVERLEYLYGLLSNAQKNDAQPFPDFPEPPPMPEAPKAPKAQKKGQENVPLPPSPPKTPDDQGFAMQQQELALAEREILLEEYKEALHEQVAEIQEYEALAQSNEYALGAHEEALEEQELALLDYQSALQEMPLAPPPPQSPLDHVIDMAKKDAIFYYEGKKISSDKAIAIVKANKRINIDTRSANSKRPTVRLSTEPIRIGN